MAEPLVSVLIPVYNHARYVRQCLDSLLSEGWPNLEVLVTDDGSMDGSYEVVHEWRKEHPDAFTHFELTGQENQGLPKTLNRMVTKARGEYLTLVASDDYLLPGGIAKRVSALNQHPKWMAVIGNAWIVDSLNQLLHKDGALTYKGRPRWVLSYTDTLKRELLIRWWSPGPTLLLRRESFDPNSGIGLYDESISFEDRDYYIRLLIRDALGFVDYPVAAYRVDPARLAAPPARKMLMDEAYCELKYLNCFTGYEKLALWTRAHRTLAKLMSQANTRSILAKVRLWALHGAWAFILTYHWTCLQTKNLRLFRS